MLQYLIRRVIAVIPVFFIVTVVVFVLMRLTPGDPIQVEFGQEITPELYEAKREELGLNRPMPVQYVDWLSRMLTGDFGRSLRAREPVGDLIKERLPATLQLAVLSQALILLVAIPWGVFAAIYRHSWFATFTTAITFASISAPGFFVATMLVFLFTFQIRIFETPRYVPFFEDPIANLRNLVLPVVALSYGGIATFTRLIRSNVLEVLNLDYVRTARAKGLSEWTVFVRHALRNALIPSVTILGVSLTTLWGGAVITERIFNWPGIGRLAFTALQNRDYPVTQAFVVISTVSVMAGTLLVDVLYTMVDPRIKHVGR
jgi:peptide/nickel transport system permease protein